MSLMVEPVAVAVSELVTGAGCCACTGVDDGCVEFVAICAGRCVLRGGFCIVGVVAAARAPEPVTAAVCVGAVCGCCVAIMDGAGGVPGFFPCTSMMSR